MATAALVSGGTREDRKGESILDQRKVHLTSGRRFQGRGVTERASR